MRRVAVVGAGVVMIAALFALSREWWPTGDGSVARAAGERTSGAADETTAPPPEAAVATRPEAEREPAPTLELVLVGAEGRPAHGHVYWSVSEDVPRTPPFLAPEQQVALPADVQQRAVAGSTRMTLPHGAWVWLYARWEERGGAGRFARVPPFRGHQRLSLRAEPVRRTLHVFVLDEELTGPATGGEVQLFGLGEAAPAAPTARGTFTTDATGYVRIDGLAPGHYIVCAPGADERDDAPHTARLMFAARTAPCELAVTLAMPERRSLLRLRVSCPADFRSIRPVRVFLQRVDDGTGSVVPVPGALRPGSHQHELRVAPGSYRIRTLPVGACEIAGGSDTVTVGVGPASAAISVVEARAGPTVELKGITRAELPVSVYAEPTDDALGVPPDLLFCGPLRWHRARQKIGALPSPCRLVVRHRSRYWVGRDPIAAERGHIEVELVPATKLAIRWRDAVVPRAGVVFVDTARGPVVGAVRRELTTVGAVPCAALVGTLVVPSGEIAVRGRVEGHPELSWERRLRAEGGYVRIDIGGGTR